MLAVMVAPTVGINPLDPIWIATLVGIVTVSSAGVAGVGGGATFAIYPKGDNEAMQQVEQMREDGRVDMYAEADYSEGTTAYMWITNRIQRMADRIRNAEKEKIMSSASGVPHHLV